MNEGEAHRVETITDAVQNARQRNPGLAVSYERDGLKIQTPDEIQDSRFEVLERSVQRQAIAGVRAQLNLEDVGARALRALPPSDAASTEMTLAEVVEDEAPGPQIDPQWASTFIESAETTYSEDLRELLGRILAGEIQEPGSYSLRTLRTLRSLSPEEAQLFAKYGRFMFRSPKSHERGMLGVGVSAPIGLDPLKDRSADAFSIVDLMTLDEWERLVELGLLSANQGTVYQFTANGSAAIEYAGRVVVGSTAKGAVNVLGLTVVGTQIASLLDHVFEREYITKVMAAMCAPGVEIVAYSGFWRFEQQIRFDNSTREVLRPATDD